MNTHKRWKTIDNNQHHEMKLPPLLAADSPQAGHRLTCHQSLTASLLALLAGFVTGVVSWLSPAILEDPRPTFWMPHLCDTYMRTCGPELVWHG